MKRWTMGALCAALLAGASATAHADWYGVGTRFTFTTLATTPLAIEGLTGDGYGGLYTTGRATAPARCPVWRIDANAPAPVTPVQIGSIPNDPASPCNPSGIAWDDAGSLYVADAAQNGVIWKVAVNVPDPTVPYATGVPGTNGIAFDRSGNLWTADGTQAQGRVWKIAPGGGNCEPTFVGCAEMFRIPPLANAKGVGRQVSTLQPPAAANPQPLVANGLAFTPRGDLLVADTARGALWLVYLTRDGTVFSPVGCDATYTPDTLCLANVYMQHPLLEGVDGIALDRWGNVWNAANERNAIVVVTPDRRAVEVFRNPVNQNGLRNAADTAEGNRHILELPTSPYIEGRRLCVAQSDGDRRDNSPRSAGEVNGGGGAARGKISCADQPLSVSGLPLPVH